MDTRKWFAKRIGKSTSKEICTMTPEEKARKAIRILALLDANVRHAFEVKAYFCRAAYENDIKSYFDSTTGAPGYNQITLSLYYDLIMTVVRIFDNLPNKAHADNTASLPELISLLRDNSAVEVLKEQERLARTLPNDLIKAKEVADPGFSLRQEWEVLDKVNDFAKTIVKLVGDYNRLGGSHLLRGLREIRHQILAHTAININDRNVAHFGDAENLLDQTAQYIANLNATIRRINDNYDQHKDRCTVSADDFWLMVTKNQS
jgi:hypothetical protein